MTKRTGAFKRWDTLLTGLEESITKASAKDLAAEPDFEHRSAFTRRVIDAELARYGSRDVKPATLPSAPQGRRDLLRLLLGSRPSLSRELSLAFRNDDGLSDRDVRAALETMLKKGLLRLPKDGK